MSAIRLTERTIAGKLAACGYRHLGTVVYDPQHVEEVTETITHTSEETGETTEETKKTRKARPVYFIDQRLSVLDVTIACAAAVVGIVALAAAITGCLFIRIHPVVRIGMFIAAMLLLSPDVRVGATQIGTYLNIAGYALFAVTCGINYMRSRGKTAA
jgi:uncharacterized membrane protein YkgB